jgi:hypothetical protein
MRYVFTEFRSVAWNQDAVEAVPPEPNARLHSWHVIPSQISNYQGTIMVCWEIPQIQPAPGFIAP